MSTFVSGMNYDLLKDVKNLIFVAATAYYGYFAGMTVANPIQHLQVCLMSGMASEVIDRYCEIYPEFDYYEFYKSMDNQIRSKLIVMADDAYRNCLLHRTELLTTETIDIISEYFKKKYDEENPEIDQDISDEVDRMVKDIENGKDVEEVVESSDEDAEPESEEDD